MIDYAMWGMCGLLVLFLAFGAMWGAIGGWKRALIRLATVVPTLVIAMLIAPPIAGACVKSILGALGYGDLQAKLLPEDSTLGAVADGAKGMVDIVYGLATVVATFVVFFVLYYLLKALSYIVYKVLAAKFAPKKAKTQPVDPTKPLAAKADPLVDAPQPYDPNGTANKVRLGRWGGVGIGIVTALISFAFIMIPINGLIQMFDSAAGYAPTFAEINKKGTKDADKQNAFTLFSLGEDSDGNDITVRTVNTRIQKSPYGIITKYTGVQSIGQMGMTYFMTMKVDKKRVNLRNDIVKVGRLATDAVVVYKDVQGVGIDKRAEDWETKEYKHIQDSISRIFKISLVELVFGYVEGDEENDGLVDTLQNKGTLDDKFNAVTDDEGEFADAAYGAMKTYTKATKLNDDLNGFVEIARLLFQKPTADKQSLFGTIKEIVNTFGDGGDELALATAKFDTGVKFDKETDPKNLKNPRNRFQAVVDRFMNLHLVQAMFDLNLDGLYQSVLADKLHVGEVTIGKPNYKTAGQTTADVVADLISVLPDIADFAHGDDDTATRIKNMNTEKLAIVLDDLTNHEGVGGFTRAFLIKTLEGFKMSGEEESGDKDRMSKAVDEMLDILRDKLSYKPGTPHFEEKGKLEWTPLLKTLQSAADFSSDPKDNAKMDALIDCVIESELFVVPVANMICGMAGDSSINIILEDHETYPELAALFLTTMKGTIETFTQAFAGNDATLDANDPLHLLTMLGAGNSDGTLTKLAALNTAAHPDAIRINIGDLVNEDNRISADVAGAEVVAPIEYNMALAILLEEKYKTPDYPANCADDLKTLFGLGDLDTTSTNEAKMARIVIQHRYIWTGTQEEKDMQLVAELAPYIV